jgi:hypothetical protein
LLVLVVRIRYLSSCHAFKMLCTLLLNKGSVIQATFLVTFILRRGILQTSPTTINLERTLSLTISMCPVRLSRVCRLPAAAVLSSDLMSALSLACLRQLFFYFLWVQFWPPDFRIDQMILCSFDLFLKSSNSDRQISRLTKFYSVLAKHILGLSWEGFPSLPAQQQVKCPVCLSPTCGSFSEFGSDLSRPWKESYSVLTRKPLLVYLRILLLMLKTVSSSASSQIQRLSLCGPLGSSC